MYDAFVVQQALWADGFRVKAIVESERLIDIPIEQDMESIKDSSEASETGGPILDKETGLFKVRPKVLRSGRSLSKNSFRSKVGGTSTRSSSEDLNEEIQAVVETSKALEIRFKGGTKVVSKRLRELEEAKDLDLIFSPVIGSAGGLISTWDPDFFIVDDKIINRIFIALVGAIRDGGQSFGFVNVYGPSSDSEKTEFFSELSQVIGRFNISWVVGGDFNAYLAADEKMGFSCNSFSMRLFKDFLQNIQRIDLPLTGGAFTWCNNRDPPTFVRLDRFIVTADVVSKILNLSQALLTKAISDHNAILLHSTSQNWGPKPFKFFNSWLEKQGFDDLMASVLSKQNSGGQTNGIDGLLRCSKVAIKSWAKS
ncbi:hypothetical protein V6N12_035357 [Hibiscus sabdariffa]|uniref:Endonuclease/exonuclease/phosphatase domain-containing protein n=1 Tax=Hibiscus sabdariffa TaxID=183260 RepID=A0ABR2BSB4_9ROSI